MFKHRVTHYAFFLSLFLGMQNFWVPSLSAREVTTTGWNSKRGTLWDVAVSQSGERVAVGAAAGFVNIFDQKLNVLHTLNLGKKPVYSVAFSPDERQLAACNSAGQVKIFDVVTGQLKQTFQPGAYCSLVAFGQGLLAVAGSPTSKEKHRSVWLYRLSESGVPSPPQRFIHDPSPVKYVSAMTFAPDGKTLAVGSSNRRAEVNLFNCADKIKPLRTLKTRGDVSALRFSPDGVFLAGGGTAGQVNLWKVSTGQRFWQKPWRAGKQFISSVDFSPDGNHVAVCGMGYGPPVTLYRKGNGKLIDEVGKKRGMNCNQIRYDPSGKMLYLVRQVFSDFNEQVLTRYQL